MEESELKLILDELMDDVLHEFACLNREFPRILKFNKSAVRARTHTMKLQKLFKRFREITINAGLK